MSSRPRPAIVIATLLGAVMSTAGCDRPVRIAKYPEGSLHVRYEQATTYSTCLVASVAMAGNYLLGERRFSEYGIRNDIERTGRDVTLVRDLQAYLADEGLDLHALSGQLGDEAPTGVGFWVKQRGYPAICVINRVSEDPAFNHAVVVIGISPNREGGSTDIIHYLDPSVPEPLQSMDAAAFEELWARCEHALLIVAVAPADRREPVTEETR